jgi:hypothetical protein
VAIVGVERMGASPMVTEIVDELRPEELEVDVSYRFH